MRAPSTAPANAIRQLERTPRNRKKARATTQPEPGRNVSSAAMATVPAAVTNNGRLTQIRVNAALIFT